MQWSKKIYQNSSKNLLKIVKKFVIKFIKKFVKKFNWIHIILKLSYPCGKLWLDCRDYFEAPATIPGLVVGIHFMSITGQTFKCNCIPFPRQSWYLPERHEKKPLIRTKFGRLWSQEKKSTVSKFLACSLFNRACVKGQT